MKFSTAMLRCVAAIVFFSGCQESISPKESKSIAASAAKRPSSERAAVDRSGHGEQIRALIRELAKIRVEGPYLEVFPAMGGGFAPEPQDGQKFDDILTYHGFKEYDPFVQLIKIGPPALPYLLESLEVKTATKLTIDYSTVATGGMWFGKRPAVRWAADEMSIIHQLADAETSDAEIAEFIFASKEFIALARTAKPPHFLPRTKGEFNPKNPREQKVLAEARKELSGVQKRRESGPLEPPLTKYTITVGDICYVLVGEITNRTYAAAQYQPTSNIVIFSPARDARLAADVRVWTSDDPTEMLFQSLRADLDVPPRGPEAEDALIRLGYYFPERSEPLLLEYFAKVEAGEKGTAESNSQGRSFILALLGSKNQKVRDRLFQLLQATQDQGYFLALQYGFGREHDPLVLKRAMTFVEAIPQANSDRWDNVSLLQLMRDRFPKDALPIFKQFVASESKERRDTVINVLWDSPLALDLLPPLLEDKRPLDYNDHARVCDRAAQAIRNNTPEVKSGSDSPAIP